MSKFDVAKDVVSKLHEFSGSFQLESLFVLGSYPRCLVMERSEDIDTLEVSCALPLQTTRLAKLFASEVLSTPVKCTQNIVEFKYEDLTVQFQESTTHKYMYEPPVREWLKKHHIKLPLYINILSRDFTVNTLSYSLYHEKVFDVTDSAIHDFEMETIRSILPANMLIHYSPVSIFRALRFACKYDFHIDAELRAAMRDRADQIARTYSKERVSLEITKTLKMNPDKAITLIEDYGLTSLLNKAQIKALKERKEPE